MDSVAVDIFCALTTYSLYCIFYSQYDGYSYALISGSALVLITSKGEGGTAGSSPVGQRKYSILPGAGLLGAMATVGMIQSAGKQNSFKNAVSSGEFPMIITLL